MAKKKAYIRSVYSAKIEPKKPHFSLLITYLDEDLKGIQTPNEDPVVVLVVIAKFEVWKMLVNSKSAVDILFCKTL